MTEQKQALSTRGVAVVGVDTSAIIRRTLERMKKQLDEQELQQRIEAEKWKYNQRETLYVLEKQLDETVNGRCSWETIERVGKEIVKAYGTRRELRAEFRMQLARAYFRHKLVKTWDEARDRAAKVEVLFA